MNYARLLQFFLSVRHEKYFLYAYSYVIAAFWLKASPTAHLDYYIYEGMEIGVSQAFKWNIVFIASLSFCLNSRYDIRTGKRSHNERMMKSKKMRRDNNTPIFIFIIMIVYVLSEITKKTERK